MSSKLLYSREYILILDQKSKKKADERETIAIYKVKIISTCLWFFEAHLCIGDYDIR
jgi:hypothetical protein